MATIYKYNDYEYRDEAAEFTTEEVRSQLTQYFPELANAEAKESKDGDGNPVITFVKRAGTKGRPGAADISPMPDAELAKLESYVRCACDGGHTLELDPGQVLSLIGEAWYLRKLLGEPQSGVPGDARG